MSKKKERQRHKKQGDIIDEIRSQAVPDKRGKASITHLLELQYKPPRHDHTFPSSSYSSSSSRHHHPSRRYRQIHIEKQTYINITCRFVMDPRLARSSSTGRSRPGSGASSVHTLGSGISRSFDPAILVKDPDEPVPMDCVMRVIAPMSSCPICLESRAECPRMLECGHILCYPCLFRYLADESGSQKRECPLCFDRFNTENVKPVNFSTGDDRFDAPHPGHDAVFKLLVRPVDSMVVVPRDVVESGAARYPADFHRLPSVDKPDMCKCARIMMGSVGYAIAELEREIGELKVAKEQAMLLYNDEGKWYNRAIQVLFHTLRAYKGDTEVKEVTSNGAHTNENINTTSTTAKTNTNSNSNKLNDSDTLDADSNALAKKLDEDLSKTSTAALPPATITVDDSNAYFFYQTGFDSSTKYFLNSLDIRILRRAYGHYSNFPDFIVAKVENVIHGMSIEEETRKKIKYLRYLPEHTPIGLVECDWRETISKDVLEEFSGELQKRKKKLLERKRKEDLAKKKYDKQEADKLQDFLGTPRDSIGEFGFSEPQVITSVSTDPALPLSHEGIEEILLASEEQGLSSSSSSPPKQSTAAPSFADAASGRNANDREIADLLSRAEVSNKNGKRKVVILSAGGAGRWQHQQHQHGQHQD